MGRGLTLIECLLAGAAACVVGVIVFPVVVRMDKGCTRRMSCTSNLKQLATGAMMYAQDYEEQLPARNWRASLEPYLQHDQLWRCPDNVGTRTDLNRPTSYAGNAHLGGVALSRLARPDHEPLLLEAQGIGATGMSNGSDFLPHRDGSVSIAFADGHVPRPSAVFQLRIHPPLLLSGSQESLKPGGALPAH